MSIRSKILGLFFAALFALSAHADGVINSGIPSISAASDYSAGTWTPTITASTTPGTPAYTTQVGTYEKIGRQVTVRFTLQLSGWTGTPAGNVSITGLPFTSGSTASDGGDCMIPLFTIASAGPPTANISPSSTSISVYGTSATSNIGSQLTAAQSGTTPLLIGLCNYHI